LRQYFFFSQHRRGDTSISSCVIVGTPSSIGRQEAKRKNSSLLPLHRSPQFFSDRPLFFPSSGAATPFASSQHLLSAAIFRIRYLRSQLQISRIPRAEVPLDRTLSDTTRSLFPINPSCGTIFSLSRSPYSLFPQLLAVELSLSAGFRARMRGLV